MQVCMEALGQVFGKKEGNSLEASGGQVGNDMPETER